MKIRTVTGPINLDQLGRDAVAMQEIAEKSGMRIVCATGFYFEAMDLPVYWHARLTQPARPRCASA